MLVQVVTPRGEVLREDVDELVAPGAAGEFGILAGHLPIVAALDAGLMLLRKGTGATPLVVDGGFLEQTADRITVITQRALQASEIDAEEARAELAEAEEAMRTRTEAGPAEAQALQRAWRLAAAKLQALEMGTSTKHAA